MTIILCESKTKQVCANPAEALLLFHRSSWDEVTTSHTSVAALRSGLRERPILCKSMLIHVKPWGCTLWASWAFKKRELTIVYQNDAPPVGKHQHWVRYGFPLDMSSLLENQTNTWKTTRIYSASLCGKSIFSVYFAFLQMSVRLYSCMHSKNARLGGQEGKKDGTLTTQWRKRLVEKFSARQYAM